MYPTTASPSVSLGNQTLYLQLPHGPRTTENDNGQFEKSGNIGRGYSSSVPTRACTGHVPGAMYLDESHSNSAHIRIRTCVFTGDSRSCALASLVFPSSSVAARRGASRRPRLSLVAYWKETQKRRNSRAIRAMNRDNARGNERDGR